MEGLIGLAGALTVLFLIRLFEYPRQETSKETPQEIRRGSQADSIRRETEVEASEDRHRSMVPFVFAGGALLLAVLDWPYGYYQILRVIVVIAGIYGFVAFKRLNSGWRWAFPVIAFPWLVLSVSREVWITLDVIGGLSFIALAGIGFTIQLDGRQRRQHPRRGVDPDSGDSARACPSCSAPIREKWTWCRNCKTRFPWAEGDLPY